MLWALLLLTMSCSSHKVLVTILGEGSNYVEVYDGHKVIIKDSISSSPITGVAKVFNTKYDFKDSMHVIMRFSDGDSMYVITKLPKSKFIYIHLYYIELKVYGTNKKKGFL